MLTEKNATMGPSEASTATMTPSVATSKRITAASVSREPTSALKTYSDGSVTSRVRKKSAGTLTMLATTCITLGPRVEKSANVPMQAP